MLGLLFSYFSVMLPMPLFFSWRFGAPHLWQDFFSSCTYLLRDATPMDDGKFGEEAWDVNTFCFEAPGVSFN